MKWNNKTHYFLDLRHIKRDEIQEIENIFNILEEKWYPLWCHVRNGKLMIPAPVLDSSLDAKLAFVHLVGKLEEREMAEDDSAADDAMPEKQHVRYSVEFER